MPVMLPATSERNLMPSSTAPGSPPSTIAGVGLDGQIMTAPAFTVMPRALVTFWAPAVTRTVKLEVPIAVGVPEIAPVPGVSVSPAGSVPLASDQVYGGVPPLAATVALDGWVTAPPGGAGGGTVRAPAATVTPVLPLTAPSVAVIVVVPGPTALARPPAVTVAAAVFDELQETWLVRFWVLVSE